MMQLICSGQRLDLYENTDLQFTEENPLFAFDSIKCERTTNFKLPATPANDRVFALARIPAYAGEGMRRKFAAQLQLGTIVKDGYLYVSSWSGKEYEAIFITGEMVGLQAIKDAGKITEYYRPNNTLVWDVLQIKDANTAAGQTIWALTRYLCGNANLILPSADLADIISNAYFAVTQRQLTGLQRGWRLIPQELKGIPTSSLEVHYEGTGNRPGTLETNPADANRMSTTLAPLVRFINTTLVMYNGQLNDRFWRVQQLVAGQTLKLTFPADFSSDYFLIGIRDLGTQGTDPLYSPFSTEWFLGGYYFSPNLNTSTNETYGTPLAGKTVEVPAGTPFMFVKKNWITWRPNGLGSAGVIYGFTQLADVGNVYTLTIQVDGNDIASGNVVRLADNLPELTLIELLKIYAYLTGTQLYYNGQDIEFDDLFFISWKRFDISKQLLSIGKVTRTFADYAQRNIVGFDSAEDVPYSQRITAEYDINNDNIETNKEVGKIPYSEGQIGIANNEQVAQFDMEESYGKKMQKSGIMEARGISPDGNTHGLRVTLPTNPGIQSLCDASTQVEVQARMSAYEYAQITAKTRILCRGTEYVWTSRSWQKDTAKFVLAKLPPLDYYGLTAEARAEIEQAYGFDVLVNTYLYLRENPSASSYLNEHPLDAALYGRAYIQDGLILQLDRGFGCETSSWEDFIANIIYTGNNIDIVNNAPVFNGSSSYYAGAPLNSSYDNCTIEIVFKRNNNNTSMIFCDGNTSRGLIIVYSGGKYTTCAASTSANATPTAVSNVQVGEISILSSAKNVRYENGSLLTNSGTDWWGGRDQSYIGGRVIDGVLGMPFSGSIYTIRVYNRLLSSSEMRANQDIDTQRFL